MSKRIRVKRVFEDGSSELVYDAVAEERRISIYVNRRLFAQIYVSPSMLEELVVGYLITNGLIASADQVRRVVVKGDVVEALVDLKRVGRAIEAATTHRVSASALLESVSSLTKLSKVYSETGGVHSASINRLEDGSLLAFGEDVSRLYAIDKAVGSAALKGLDLSRCLLCSTGRVSREVVRRARNAGVWVIASKAAATSLAVELAELWGLTVVGFARDGRMNVYAGEERISPL